MESEIGWKIVPNTVANRMIDFSLIHKLIPSKKVRRTSKAMNIAIKKLHRLKTYRQYVKMKTSILRNLSDSSDTNDNDSFSEDDYNILYKSNLSLKDDVSSISQESVNCSYEKELNSSKNEIICNTTNKRTITQKPKNKSKEMNFGWKEVIKNKTKSSHSFLNNSNENSFADDSSTSSHKTVVQRNEEDDLQAFNNHKSFLSSSEKSILSQETQELKNNETCIQEKGKNTKTANSNEIKYDITVVPEVTNNNNKSIKEINPMVNKVNLGFQSDENHYHEISDNHKMQTLKRIKKNLTYLLDDINEVQNNNDSFTNIKVHSDQNYPSLLEKDPDVQETSTDENKNNKFLKTQPSFSGTTSQPKDSGIEEDTEEEFLEDGKKNYKKIKKKVQKAQQNSSIQTTASILSQRNNSIVQTDTNNVLSEDYSTSNEMNLKNMKMFLDVDTSDKGDNKKTTQRYKLQPTVTCTEIVNKKYKIISPNSCTNSELSLNNSCNEEVFITQQTEQSIEGSILPLTEKRLKQLRRLNLTVESESSLSEDDDTYCSTENVKNRCSKESSDILDSKDDKIHTKHRLLIQFNKKLQKDQTSKIGRYKQKNILNSITETKKHMKKKKLSKHEVSVQSPKFIEFNDSSCKCTSKCSHKKDLYPIVTHCKDTSQHSLEETICCSTHDDISESCADITESSCSQIQQLSFTNNKSNRCESRHLDDVRNYNFDQNKDKKESKNQQVGTTMQVSNEKSITRNKPCNLQELIKEECLDHQIPIPSFRFKDIHEDDIFLLDIPSMAFENHLLGKKIVLTEKKLKLGKQKYKVEYKDIGSISCIFGSRKSHKPYKTVNIKPTARIVACQKINKTPL